MKTYCFKLYKSRKNKKLDSQINIACYVYNYCISLYRRYYKLFCKLLNKYRLQKHLTKLKRMGKYAFWKNIPSHAIKDITDRISSAYNLFLNNLKRKVKATPPRFKPVHKYKSFSYNEVGKNVIRGNTIKIAGSCYKFFKSRDVEGKIKLLTVKRDNLGDFYVYLICEVEQNEVLARMGKSVGFDFGLKKFLTSSDGYDIVSPLFFKQNSNLLKNASRRLSHKIKGSNNYKRAKLALARLHKKVANKRNDFHWQLANRLCGEYATICIEDLNLKGMQRLYGKKISDLGFSSFLSKLEYVACKTGTQIIKTERFFPSSQLCSVCGYQNHDLKNLKIRYWTCPYCGTLHDRDRNAAVNILNQVLA